MKIIHRIGAANESTITREVLLAAGIFGPLGGYLGFGRMGLFVTASTLGALILAHVLWLAFVPATKMPR